MEIPIRTGIGDSIQVAISIGQSGINGHCHFNGNIKPAIASIHGVKSFRVIQDVDQEYEKIEFQTTIPTTTGGTIFKLGHGSSIFLSGGD